jgi:uncharacterized protein
MMWRVADGPSGARKVAGVERCVQTPTCKRRLALFGSAAAGLFDPASSDLDFVVEFEPLSPAQHADSYFGLQEDLKRVFRLPVDLVESGPIRNPYFKRAIEQTQVVLYAVA